MPGELPLNELHGEAVRLDRSGVVVSVSRLFQRLAGDENAGSGGHLWPDLASPEITETALGSAIAEALRDKLFGELQSNLVAPSGAVLRRHWFGAPIHDASGVIDGAVVVGEEWGGPPDQEAFPPDQTPGLDDAAWARAMYWELRRRIVPLLGYADLLRCETTASKDASGGIQMTHQAAGRMATMLKSTGAHFLTPGGPDGKTNERLQLLGSIANDLNNALLAVVSYAQLLLEVGEVPVTARPICEKLLATSARFLDLLPLIFRKLKDRRQMAP